MRVILESVFVGAYTLCIFLIISSIVKQPLYIILFILGCVKHSMGYFLGLHDLYCKKCSNHKRAKPPTALETVGEGVLFLVVELLISGIFTNIYANIFFLGFLLHMVFEYTGIHRWFCLTHCI